MTVNSSGEIDKTPEVDKYGLSKSDRRRIRQDVARTAAMTFSGSDLKTSGSREVEIKVMQLAGVLEYWVLNG